MEFWGKWEFSKESENRLNNICLNLQRYEQSEISKTWLKLFNYDSESYNCEMEVDTSTVDPKEEEISKAIEEALVKDSSLSESIFTGVSMNLLNRVLFSAKELLDEFKFCSLCKFIGHWNNDVLIEHALRCVVLPKLKEFEEASRCVTFSVKDLAMNKPELICQNVLIPLVCDDSYSDAELLNEIFSTLPPPEKDLIILSFTKKEEFYDKDWLLLSPLIKDLTQNSLLNLLECIQIQSYKFTKSQAFGRFLVNFCKNFNFFGSTDALREVIEKHQTLLKAQAIKYLELV